MNYQKLFDHMFQEHGLTLTEGQMQDIIHEVNSLQANDGMIEQRRKEIWREQGNNPDSYSHSVGQAMSEYAKEYLYSLQSKGKTKQELMQYFESTGYTSSINLDLYPDGKIYTQEYTEWLEKQVLSMQSHANQDGWVKEHVKCATLCAGCKEDCKGREAYFTKPQP